MKNNTSRLIYDGQVELQLKIKGKWKTIKVHNEGMPYLKYIFSKYLAGATTDIKPGYVDLIAYKVGEDVNDDNAGMSFLQSPMKANGITYSDALGYYTEFKASISSELMIDTVNVDDERTFYLYLITNIDKNTKKQYRLARVGVSVGLLAKITPGTTGAVVWKMRLLNESEVGE